MKKLLLSAAALVLLAGCGGGGSDSEKKTCTVSQQGMNVTINMEGKDNKLVKQSMELSLSKDQVTAAGQDFDKITDADMNAIAKTFAPTQETMKGLDIDAKKTADAIEIGISVDYTKMDEETKKKAGVTDMKFDETIKKMTDNGATCK